MKTFAAIATIAVLAMCGAIRADAAGYSTTKSNIKNPGTETCDPMTDKNCVPPPPTRAVSGTISGTIEPRPARPAAKGGIAKRTGDPLPDVDVSLDRKTGGAARVKAP